jgi:hypothetical protein
MKSVHALASLSLVLVACYGAAPPRPARIPLPPVVEGAQIGVFSEDRTAFETVSKQASTCPAGHAEGSPACTITRYNVKEPVTRTHTTATYDGRPISYAQFHVMTDPQYDQKLSRLDDLSHKCKRANVPRYAGMGLLLAGLIAGPIVGIGETPGKIVFYGGIAGGITSYALGYFAFGGRDCNEARAIYNDVDVADAIGTHTVQGADLAVEMAELAAQFNAAHGGGASQSAMQMRR